MSTGPISRREILLLGAAAFLSGVGSAVAAVRQRPGGVGATAVPLRSPSAAATIAAPLDATRIDTRPPVPGDNPAPSAAAAPVANERVLEVICRDSWGAAPAGEGRAQAVQWITIHHSAVLLGDNRDAPGRLRGHQRTHQGKGWLDIAYHLMVDRNGNIYEGRDPRFEGDSSTDYDLAGHLLVLCEGHFDEQDVAPAQFAALGQVVAWARQRYELGPDRVKAHKDLAQTACPGASLYKLVHRDLTDTVTAQMRHALWRQELVCGDVGNSRVQAIERGEQ